MEVRREAGQAPAPGASSGPLQGQLGDGQGMVLAPASKHIEVSFVGGVMGALNH